MLITEKDINFNNRVLSLFADNNLQKVLDGILPEYSKVNEAWEFLGANAMKVDNSKNPMVSFRKFNTVSGKPVDRTLYILLVHNNYEEFLNTLTELVEDDVFENDCTMIVLCEDSQELSRYEGELSYLLTESYNKKLDLRIYSPEGCLRYEYGYLLLQLYIALKLATIDISDELISKFKFNYINIQSVTDLSSTNGFII